MLHLHTQVLRLSARTIYGSFASARHRRPYASQSEEDDLQAAREWHKQFNKTSLPRKIAKTTFSRSSGPGGQKVNKTSSKATTVWPLHSLLSQVPKVLHAGIRASRYYVASSDSLTIQCDTNRSKVENEDETHRRLFDEIMQIYQKRVPGITSPEQKKRIEQLRKADNSARLKMKKFQGDKKRGRAAGRSGD